MSQTNINLIQQVYDAFNQRNFDAVLERFSPAIEWIAAVNSPLADRSPYRGLNDVREGVFLRIAAGFERLAVNADEVFAAGDKVVVLGFYDGLRKGNSKPVRAQLAHIWTLTEGQVIKFQQYVDTYQLAQSAN